MSDPIDAKVWAGVERRLAAIEQFVPQAPPWRPADGQVPTTRVRRVPGTGSGLGSGAKRQTTPRLMWVLVVLGLAIAFVGGAILAGGGGHPAITSAPSARPALVPGFNPTGPLTTPRYGHAATLLMDGRVLLIGGYASYPPSAELYDPDTGTFSPTGSPPLGYDIDLTSTLLRDGRVLVIGRHDATAQLYDPTTGAFSATGAMSVRRVLHAAVLLRDGRVLVIGGKDRDPGGKALASAELFDPLTGAFSATGGMASARTGPTATLLADGRVLVAGGGAGDAEGGTPLASAEIYDPVSGSFTQTGDMTTPRASHVTARLVDGRVLIVGGIPMDGTGIRLDSAEVFDPRTGRFTATRPMATARDWPTATTLRDGRVLITSGGNAGSSVSELFDPSTMSFDQLDTAANAAALGTATLLVDGDILVAGGSFESNVGLAEGRLFHVGPATTP